MYKGFLLILISLTFPVWASAQQPLSPPERPPVPLSDSDQLQAEVQTRSKPASGRSIVDTSLSPPLWSGLSSGDRVIDGLVREASVLYGVDPRLILLVMQAESGFQFRAVSPKGATGLMQLMPSTAVRLGVGNILDARENVFGGVKYLRWLLDRFGGNVQLALAGYNAGEHAVEIYGNQVPPFLETQNYVRSIVLRYSRFRLPEASEPLLAEPGTEKTHKKFPDYNQIIEFTSVKGPGQ